MRAIILLLLVVPALAASRPAHADDEIVRGAVVKIEAKEIYVSLGSDRGVTDGSALRLKRTIALRHPVTRATIEDWIPIGSASVTQAGATMSRAVVGELVGDIKLGDLVEVLIDRPDAPKAIVPVPAGAPVDPKTAELIGVFAAQVGKSLDVRIAGWERFLSAHPDSPFADGVRRDLDTLRGLRDEMQPHTTQNEETITSIAHVAPRSAVASAPISLVFVMDQPERVASAYLHYRGRGELMYRSVLLAREHEIYLRGAVPADVVRAPGVEYFLEIATPRGRSGLAIGTPSSPLVVEVARPPLNDKFASTPGRSTARLAIEYLDFATFDRRTGDHRDRVIQATVDFTYRLPGIVEDVGVGYGTYAGTGGSADRAWSATDPIPRAGFHYGYADVELGGRPEGIKLSAAGQIIAGVGERGFGMGIEGRFRIGERDGTNLALIARTVDQVGVLSEVRFGTQPVRGMLLGISVGGTDQPNEGDIGVKLGTEIVVIAIRNATFSLRGSWQGRSVAHGGIGGGTALGFSW